MRTKVQALTQHLHGFLLILGITAFLSCIMFPSEYLFYFFHSFLLLIPFCVTAWGQKKIKHLVSYLAAGTACAALLFFLGVHFFEKLYLLVISVLIMLTRIPPRLNKTDDYEIVDDNVVDSGGLLDSPGAGFLGYFILLFFVCLLLKKTQPQELIYWLTFVYLANLLVYINLKGLNGYLYSRRTIANLPGRQIVSTNRALMIVFSALTLIVMLVIPLIPLDQIVSSIGIALRDFLRWIFSHFSAEEQTVIETVAESLEAATQSPMLGEVDSTPAWLKMLYDIIFAVIVFVVSAGALAGIFYAVLLLIHRFYRPTAVSGDMQEFIDDETDASFLSESEKKKKDSFLSQLFHPNAVIRKRFKKQIKKGNASGKKAGSPIPGSLTPAELEQYANLPDDERTRLLHELYEKARYSKDGCTKEDAAALKK